MSHCEAPSPASAPPLVFAEAQTLASPLVTESILREMLLVKIEGSEEELRKLRMQLEILDSMGGARDVVYERGQEEKIVKEKKVAKKHGLPHGGKIDAPGSFWADKNDCITCVGGGVRKSFVGTQIGEMCPNALLIEEDPKTGVKLLICQCQVKSE